MTRLQALLTTAVIFAGLSAVSVSDAKPKVPPKDPKPVPVVATEEFDKAAATTALSSVDLGKCKSTNAPRGEGHITVKFAPAGEAMEAFVDKGPMVGTPVAKCIAKEFKKTKVPAFKGDIV